MAIHNPSSLLVSKVLVLSSPGTTRQQDLADAFRLAGGYPDIVFLSKMDLSQEKLKRYDLIALPGGLALKSIFGTGQAWANDHLQKFLEVLNYFETREKPILGIGNGYQALVYAGILPSKISSVVLTDNISGQHESGWVRLSSNSKNYSPWLNNIPQLECPIAHKRGRMIIREDKILPEEQVAFYYATENGGLASGRFPYNPDGSTLDVAGLTNPRGNVLGLMPHPENHIHDWQHPQWTRGDNDGICNRLFENGLTLF